MSHFQEIFRGSEIEFYLPIEFSIKGADLKELERLSART